MILITSVVVAKWFVITDTRLVHLVMCPFTPQLSLVLAALAHRGLARVELTQAAGYSSR